MFNPCESYLVLLATRVWMDPEGLGLWEVGKRWRALCLHLGWCPDVCSDVCSDVAVVGVVSSHRGEKGELAEPALGP